MQKPHPSLFKPFIKRMLKGQSDPLAFFEALVKNDDIVRLPVIKTKNYVVNDPESIHHILLANRDNYTKLGTSYERIEHVVGKGLLTTSGEEWVQRHQQYQPLFQGKHLKKYTDTIQKYTEDLLQNWETKVGQVLNISEEMLALGMNIASAVFLGLDISHRSLEMVRLIHILNHYAVTSITLWKWLPTLKNFRYQVAKKTIDRFILTGLKQDQILNEPLLFHLIQKNATGELLLPESEILGEVKNFFIAGHETTGNALSWTLYCLIKNPYTLMQVTNEIKNVLGNKLPDFETIQDLPYFDMAIQESLRLYPPIWIFTRRSIGEDTLLNYTIPANSIINILPYLIHRHPKYWHQPTIFYPERFLPEAAKSRPRCAYIPFGFGPRVCIGRQFALLNIKIILIMILQRFNFHLPNRDYKAEPLPLITLKPKNGLHLRIEKLDKYYKVGS